MHTEQRLLFATCKHPVRSQLRGHDAQGGSNSIPGIWVAVDTVWTEPSNVISTEVYSESITAVWCICWFCSGQGMKDTNWESIGLVALV